jgi:thioredoxin-like negative regulator of GroEL
MNRTQPNEIEPRETSDRELPALLQRSAEPVVVESYHGGWEKPWRGLSAQAWAELRRELGGRVQAAALETGRNRELAGRYGLEVIPTVLVFAGGEVVARFTGSVRAADVITAVRAALRRAETLESDRQELEAASSPRDVLTPVRSILRRRSSEVPSHTLARAG